MRSMSASNDGFARAEGGSKHRHKLWLQLHSRVGTCYMILISMQKIAMGLVPHTVDSYFHSLWQMQDNYEWRKMERNYGLGYNFVWSGKWSLVSCVKVLFSQLSPLTYWLTMLTECCCLCYLHPLLTSCNVLVLTQTMSSLTNQNSFCA